MTKRKHVRTLPETVSVGEIRRGAYDTSPAKCLLCGGYKERDPVTLRWEIWHRPGCAEAAEPVAGPNRATPEPAYCFSCDTYGPADGGSIQHHPKCQEHPSNRHTAGYRAEDETRPRTQRPDRLSGQVWL